MEKIKFIVHWGAFAYYLYIFGYASLFKVFQKKTMMESMSSLGFNKIWTMGIGIGELAGVIFLLIGLFKPQFKNAGVIFLFPFAIGAFTAHMAHNEYQHFYSSLIACVLSVVILLTDKQFRILL